MAQPARVLVVDDDGASRALMVQILAEDGHAVINPWAGLGFGYEIFKTSASGDDRTFKGFELLNVQVGLDWAVTRTFNVGPFASYQLFGKYSSFTASGVSNDIADSTGHSWLQVGLKAGIRL